jgi:hypothetical protein
MAMLDYFARAIEVQLFYALAITLILYSIPVSEQNRIIDFTTSPANEDLGQMSSEFQQSFNTQAGLGLVDLGMLALSSGNMMVDLILNFFTAIPSMVTLVLSAMFIFVQVDASAQATLKSFVFVAVTVIYIISLLNFLINVRSQTSGVL